MSSSAMKQAIASTLIIETRVYRKLTKRVMLSGVKAIRHRIRLIKLLGQQDI